MVIVYYQALCKELLFYQHFCEQKLKPANKTPTTDQYTLIEQSSGYANLQGALKFTAVNMHVVRETGLFSDSSNINITNLWSIIGHNGA